MKHTQQTIVSRRSFIKTLGASSLVVGFNALTGVWVTAAQAQSESGFERLPALDGTLHLDAATRAAYAEDFGNIVSETPRAVLKPGSVEDVRRMVVFAGRHGIRINGRGKGHTTYGQSQLHAGLVIDISTLQTIHTLADDYAVVDAGIRWHPLLQATLEHGLTPPVLTDYIGQTVGGTLSVGGIGGMMYRHGAQVDNVIELQVVTGTGELVTCSETQRRDLFEAALAGQGQVALIVRATIRLVPAPARIRLFNLIYPDLATMTAEITRLMSEQRFEFFEGWSFPQPDGTWVHMLQAGSYYTPPAQPDDAALLAGLHDIRPALQIQDQSFWEFASRLPLEFPKQAHPWIDLFLPYPAIDAFVSGVEQTLKPLAASDSFSILLIPTTTSHFTRPLFRAPDAQYAFGFDILRFMPIDPELVAKAVAYNRTLFDQSRELGGTYYPISAVELKRRDWQRHYGPEFDRLRHAKRRYDPDNVFAGGPDMFGV